MLSSGPIALKRGAVLSRCLPTPHPQDVAAMFNHSIPTAGPFAVAGASFLLAAPIVYILSGQAATIGQNKLLGIIDRFLDLASYIADAVDSDGSLRKDAPFTVSITKLKTLEADEEKVRGEKKREEEEGSDKMNEKGLSDDTAPLEADDDHSSSAKNENTANANKTEQDSSSSEKKEKKLKLKAAAFATEASELLERLRESLHSVSDRKRPQIRRFVGLVVFRLWVRIAKILSVLAIRRVSKVILAYVVCGALDALRARTILGRLLFLNNRVECGVGAGGRGGGGAASTPFLLTSSFRYANLAFLSEASAVMSLLFGNVSTRTGGEVANSSAPMGHHERGILNCFLSQYAFFYDPDHIHFTSSAAAVGSLFAFQNLPFVFGHRHLTGIGALEGVTKRCTLSLLGPVELTYWVFLKDFTKSSYEFFWDVVVGALAARDSDNKGLNGDEEEIDDTKDSSIMSLSSLRERFSVSFLEFLAAVAAHHGYKSPSQQIEAQQSLMETLAKEDNLLAKRLEKLLVSRATASPVGKRSYGFLTRSLMFDSSTASMTSLSSSSPSSTSASSYSSTASSSEEDQLAPAHAIEHKATIESAAIEELPDDADGSGIQKSGVGKENGKGVATTGNGSPGAGAERVTEESIELDKKKLIAATEAKKENIEAKFIAREMLRPSTIPSALLKALMYFSAKYASHYLILSFALRTLRSFYNSETGHVNLFMPSNSGVGGRGGFSEKTYNNLVLKPTAKLHNFLCATVFDGRKGIPFLWHASVVPILIALAPSILRAVLTSIVAARLRRAKRQGESRSVNAKD